MVASIIPLNAGVRTSWPLKSGQRAATNQSLYLCRAGDDLSMRPGRLPRRLWGSVYTENQACLARWCWRQSWAWVIKVMKNSLSFPRWAIFMSVGMFHIHWIFQFARGRRRRDAGGLVVKLWLGVVYQCLGSEEAANLSSNRRVDMLSGQFISKATTTGLVGQGPGARRGGLTGARA